MTVLQVYALLSPVIAFVLMSAFGAVLMKQTRRDIEQLAEDGAARGAAQAAVGFRRSGGSAKTQDREQSLAQH